MTKKESYQKILNLLISDDMSNKQLAFYTMNAIDGMYKAGLLIDLIKYTPDNGKILFDCAKAGELPSETYINALSYNLSSKTKNLRIDKEGLSDIENALASNVEFIEFDEYSGVSDFSSLKNVRSLTFNRMSFSGDFKTLPNEKITSVLIRNSYHEHIKCSILDYIINIPNPLNLTIQNHIPFFVSSYINDGEYSDCISTDTFFSLPKFNLKSLHLEGLKINNINFLNELSKCNTLEHVHFYDCGIYDFDLGCIGELGGLGMVMVIQDSTVYISGGLPAFNQQVSDYNLKGGYIKTSQVSIGS